MESPDRPPASADGALIPTENENDLAEIPDNVKKGLEIIPVASVDDLLKQALTKELVAIEWSEEDEKAAKPAKPKEGEEAVVTHRYETSPTIQEGRMQMRPFLFWASPGTEVDSRHEFHR